MRRSDSKIRIPRERPTKLHPIAAEVGKILRKDRPDGVGMVTFIGGYRPVIHIGPKSIERVEILLNTLACALTRRGHALVRGDRSIRIAVDEVPLELRIYETKRKSLHMPNKEELPRQSRYEEDHRRWPALYPEDRRAWAIYDNYPSGKLALEVTDPSRYRWNNQNLIGRWYDRTITTLGDVLGEVMVALAMGAAAVKLRRAEEIEQARLAAEEEERRKREAARRERAGKRRKFLTALADEYAAYAKLRDFAPVLLDGSSAGGTDPTDRMGRVLQEMLAEMSRRFDRGTLNAQIERLALFGEGDPA